MKNKMKIRDKSNKDPKDPKLNAAFYKLRAHADGGRGQGLTGSAQYAGDVAAARPDRPRCRPPKVAAFVWLAGAF